MKYFFVLSLLLCCSCIVSFAQEDPALEEEVIDFVPRFSLGAIFHIGVPMGNFNDNIDGLSVGVGGNFLIRTNPKSTVPVLAGLSARWSTYDSESQDQLVLIDGFTVDANLTTRNSIFMSHGILRILPPTNLNMQPYIEGLIGFKNLYTRTTLEEDFAFEEDETIESYIEQGDWAFSYGGTVGIQFVIGGDLDNYLLLDISCSYLQGNAADYLVRIDDPNLQIVDTIDAFEARNSTTDLLLPQIGFSILF